MKLLALDTSTEYLSLALQYDQVLMTHHALAGASASQQILPQIQAMLKQAQLKLADLDGIVYGAGPGAFTGVRVSVGVAQGLAYGANLPVVGINTLLALAQASGASRVIACLDARMGEIYHAAFVREKGEWKVMADAIVCKPEAAPKLDGDDWVGVGSGWKAYSIALSDVYGSKLKEILPDAMPTAEAMLQLALPKFERGETQTASEAMPIYVRNRVALTAAQRAQGQVL